MADTFSVFAALAAAVGFAAAAVLFLFRGKRSAPNILFSAALAVTAVWATSIAVLNSGHLESAQPSSTLAALRDGSWFVAILGLLRRDSGGQSLWRHLAIGAAVLVAADLAFATSGAILDTGLGLRLSPPLMQIATSIMGLVLVENLLLNLNPQRRWSVRLMGISLSTLFCYNIVMNIPEFLGGKPIDGFVAAQPLVYLLALPLFGVTGVRNNSLKLQVHSSRNVVFQSATLIFAGILLQGTALAAFYVRSFGGAPAVALSIVFGFAGVLLIALVLSSRTARSHIRTFIAENFYNYKYDYRLEWTKFIQALSRHEEQAAAERALRTLADLLDSQGGVLWVRRAGWSQYMPLASWCFEKPFGPIAADDPLLADIGDESTGFVEISGAKGTEKSAIWRERFPSAWLVVPLHLRGDVIGIALLLKPRAPRRLDWEDRKLVSLIAMQLALFIVHEQIAQELADSQQLIEFNNRVAFALHDVKNTIGQLRLVLHNAQRFGDNPEFRADMMRTIETAADNLQGLLGKLRKGSPAETISAAVKSRVDVCGLVARCVERRSGIGLQFHNLRQPMYAEIAGADELESALEHVITNALEASPAGSNVRLSVDLQNGRVRVRIEDNGPGMSPEFVAHELFRPLRTTKKKGLGIGAYQARSIMRNLGGDMEVQSAVGQGTTVSLLLPACKDAERRLAS